jgi:hypothetical protein
MGVAHEEGYVTIFEIVLWMMVYSGDAVLRVVCHGGHKMQMMVRWDDGFKARRRSRSSYTQLRRLKVKWILQRYEDA